MTAVGFVMSLMQLFQKIAGLPVDGYVYPLDLAAKEQMMSILVRPAGAGQKRRIRHLLGQ